MLDYLNKGCANTVTLLNVVFGSLSLVYTLNQEYSTAAIFILVAVLMDSLDGRIARRLDISSQFGKELDSLCDLVSFGVAPALLVYAQVLNPYVYSLGLITAILYIVCGAFRLARFNVLNLSGAFMGIPITLAGAIVAVLSFFSASMSATLVLLVLLFLAVMMVSKIKVPKL